ncbi:MAG: hypothetical protein DWP92_04165 [Armatimonadetes bacterium]|nr:MAG: hypothetical protein DWP92_04165 [Armatimonadota bacterium]
MTADFTADQVWNRAALESGGQNPGPGDNCLAALLAAHGLICNGGVRHAIDVLRNDEVAAAVRGYRYFGLTRVAEFLEGCVADPESADWTDENDKKANRRYVELVPEDAVLVAAFEKVFRARGIEFAPEE